MKKKAAHVRDRASVRPTPAGGLEIRFRPINGRHFHFINCCLFAVRVSAGAGPETLGTEHHGGRVYCAVSH